MPARAGPSTSTVSSFSHWGGCSYSIEPDCTLVKLMTSHWIWPGKKTPLQPRLSSYQTVSPQAFHRETMTFKAPSERCPWSVCTSYPHGPCGAWPTTPPFQQKEGSYATNKQGRDCCKPSLLTPCWGHCLYTMNTGPWHRHSCRPRNRHWPSWTETVSCAWLTYCQFISRWGVLSPGELPFRAGIWGKTGRDCCNYRRQTWAARYISFSSLSTHISCPQRPLDDPGLYHWRSSCGICADSARLAPLSSTIVHWELSGRRHWPPPTYCWWSGGGPL